MRDVVICKGMQLWFLSAEISHIVPSYIRTLLIPPRTTKDQMSHFLLAPTASQFQIPRIALEEQLSSQLPSRVPPPPPSPPTLHVFRNRTSVTLSSSFLIFNFKFRVFICASIDFRFSILEFSICRFFNFFRIRVLIFNSLYFSV